MPPSLFSPLKPHSVHDKVHAIAWSNDKNQPLLAVASNKQVLILQKDGTNFEQVSFNTSNKDAAPLLVSWSPNNAKQKDMLASAWDDGTILVWSVDDRRAREDKETHAPHPPTILEWSPLGSQFITADARPSESGELPVLALWKVDPKLHPSWPQVGPTLASSWPKLPPT